MLSDQAPCNAAGLVELPQSVTSYLRDQRDGASPLLGGILSDTKLAWLSKGPLLEVLRTCDGSKIAAWTFGAVVRDFKTKVTCVTELPHPGPSGLPGQTSQLLVGLECELTGGMVCLFNLSGSRVLRAINVSSKVTALSVVTLASQSSGPLHQCFKTMSGIVAVGTNDGQVLLIDLRRNDCDNALRSGPKTQWEGLRDELQSCGLIHLKNANAAIIEDYPDDHLYLHINERYFSKHQRLVVQFSSRDGNAFLPEDPSVTSLLYIPQLASLCVGFAFGSFQIWSLQTLSLVYTLPSNEPNPVVQLSFQEACDDPNAYCYLWTVRGGLSPNNLNGDLDRPVTVFGPPRATMFSLCYDEKLLLPEYGHFYKNFSLCSAAFDYDLSGQEDSVGGRLISLHSVSGGMQGLGAIQPSYEDASSLGSSANAISFAIIVWETWGPTGPSSSVDPVHTHMSLFDINQWYVDQMPSCLSQRGGTSRNKSIASYIVSYDLANVVSTSGGMLLDIRVNQNSLVQFSSVQNAEEFSRPSSLTFDSEVLMERQVVHLKHPGVQRALISNLLLTGPSVLMTPTNVFHECVALGLRPLLMDLSNSVNIPLEEQRTFVLCVALEQQLGRFVCRCAREWADGRLSAAGCTLSWLLSVAWNRAAVLKQLAIRICAQLFDHSGEKLDYNAQRQLHHIKRIFHLLEALFENVVQNKWHLALNEGPQVSLQNDALKLENQYYDALQWLIDVELLPEGPNAAVPYPAEEIAEFYHSRRNELRQLFQQYADGEKIEDVLMIDSLLKSQEGGANVLLDWERDAGGRASPGAGSYPPVSLQALLRTFLIKDVSLSVKHSIVIYLLMDLANILDNERYQNALQNFIKFPAAFRVSIGSIKLIQAFWHLDNKAFDTALDMLLNPMISVQDVEPSQHRAVIRLLTVQGQVNMALRYIRARRPPLQDQSDIRLHLTLLIANDLINEAFIYQRNHRTHQNAENLLSQFFQGCEEHNQLKTVLQFCLDDVEEVAFSKYLESSRHPAADDLRVLYLLKRSRYVEAFDVNQDLRKKGRSGSTRDIVVNGFFKTLPSVTRKLSSHCLQQQHKLKSWSQVMKPSPLFLNTKIASPQLRYKSSMLEAAVAKSRETWAKFVDRLPQEALEIESTPFLCTPRAKRLCHSRPVSASVPYPTQKLLERKRAREDDDTDVISSFSLKRSRFQTLERTLVELQQQEQQKSAQARYSTYSCTDTLPLLHTPVVQRRSPSSRAKLQQQMIASSPGHSSLTPQSIIKVRPTSISSEAESSKRPRVVRELQHEAELTEEESESELCASSNKPKKGESETDSDPGENDNEEAPVGVTARRIIDFDSDISTAMSVSESSIDSQVSPSHSPSTLNSSKNRITSEQSLSKMVVLAEARKAGKPVHTVTFGKGSICVYDQDEPVDAEVSVQDESSNDTVDQEPNPDDICDSKEEEDEELHHIVSENPESAVPASDKTFRIHHLDTSGIDTLSSSEIQTDLSHGSGSDVFHSAENTAQETLYSASFRKSLARPSLREITEGLRGSKRGQTDDSDEDGSHQKNLQKEETAVHVRKSARLDIMYQDTVSVNQSVTADKQNMEQNVYRSSVGFAKSAEACSSGSKLTRPPIALSSHISVGTPIDPDDSLSICSNIQEGSVVSELFSAQSELFELSDDRANNESCVGNHDQHQSLKTAAAELSSGESNPVLSQSHESVEIVELDESCDESVSFATDHHAQKELVEDKDDSIITSDEDDTENRVPITENSNIFMTSHTDHFDSSSNSQTSFSQGKHDEEEENNSEEIDSESSKMDLQSNECAVTEEKHADTTESQAYKSTSNHHQDLIVISEEAVVEVPDLSKIGRDHCISQEVLPDFHQNEPSVLASDPVDMEQDDMPQLRLDAATSNENLSESPIKEVGIVQVPQHSSHRNPIQQPEKNSSFCHFEASNDGTEGPLDLPSKSSLGDERISEDATSVLEPSNTNQTPTHQPSKRRGGTRRTSVSSTKSEVPEEDTPSRRVTRSRLKSQTLDDGVIVAQKSVMTILKGQDVSPPAKISHSRGSSKQVRKRHNSASSAGSEAGIVKPSATESKADRSCVSVSSNDLEVDKDHPHLDKLGKIPEEVTYSESVSKSSSISKASESNTKHKTAGVPVESLPMESYETTRRLTRHQRALLSRSRDISAATSALNTPVHPLKEEEEGVASDDDRMSHRSVRSSLRRKVQLEEETAPDSPNSTASTVLNPALTPTIRRRRHQSSSDASELNRDTSPVSSVRRRRLPGTPSSVCSTPTRRSARLTAKHRDSKQSEDGDNQSVASLSPSSVASGPKSASRRPPRRLSLSSETSEQYAFASPHVEHPNINENTDTEAGEPFVFSPPKTVDAPSQAKGSSTDASGSASKKNTRQSRASALQTIKEESSTSRISSEDSVASTSVQKSSHRQSWCFIEPPAGKGQPRQSDQGKKVSTKKATEEKQVWLSAYPLRKKFSVTPIPQNSESDTDSRESIDKKKVTKSSKASSSASSNRKKKK